MMACSRCAGNILDGYDEQLREWYQYCLQCGSRPQVTVRRADGKSVEAAPRCSCGRECRLAEYKGTGMQVYTSKCAVCRERQNRCRRRKKAEQRKEVA